MALTDFDFVLFGGGGDLAMRKLIPALYALSRGKGFPEGGRIIAEHSVEESFSGDGLIHDPGEALVVHEEVAGDHPVVRRNDECRWRAPRRPAAFLPARPANRHRRR